MSTSSPILRQKQRAGSIALLGLAGSVVGGFLKPDQFFKSYLIGYQFALGISLGCLGVLLLHSLVGGEWGKASRRVLQSGADVMPCMALLFLPVLLGLRHIYPWVDTLRLATGSMASTHKQLYFYLPFFIARALAYFAFWIWIGRRQRKTTDGSAVGLLVYVLTVSFASFDWIMSLEPHWSSTIYGAMLMTGNVLSALAFVILILNGQSGSEMGQSKIPEETSHDLGNLLLAFVMLWAYMSLSQYMIIWSANLPEEIGWYLVRQRGGWQAVVVILVLFQFALPFLLLLARQRKRKLPALARVAALVLVLRAIDIFWLIAPDFSPSAFSLHLLDFLTLMFVAGASMWMFCRQLEREDAL